MLFLHPGSEPDASLSLIAPDFEACARRTVECLLNRPILISRNFSTAWTEWEGSSLLCAVDARNESFAVEVSLGLRRADLPLLLYDETDTELALDAVAEILNVVAGSLFNRPSVQSTYGCLRAGVPSLRPERNAAQRRWNLEGILVVHTVEIHMRFAVAPLASGGLP